MLDLKSLIEEYKDLDNRFGDTARNVLSDENFPSDIQFVDDLPTAFQSNDDCMNVFYYLALDEGFCYIDQETNKIVFDQ